MQFVPGTRDNRKLQRGSTGCTNSLFIEWITTSRKKEYSILMAFGLEVVRSAELERQILESV
jgi:hypothetical protein